MTLTIKVGVLLASIAAAVGSSTCNDMCTIGLDAHSCRDRAIYVRDKLNKTVEEAVKTSNADCVDQCSCTVAEVNAPGPVPGPSPGPGGHCHSISPGAATDAWCEHNCNFSPPNCPSALCKCDSKPPAPGPKPPAWPPTPGKDVGCTDLQKQSGCTECSDSALCNKCKDGFVLDKVTCSPNAGGIVGCEKAAESFLGGESKAACEKCAPDYYGADCTPWYKMDGPVWKQFYIYRAMDAENYPFGNANAASAMGVIGYLHHEVVGLEEFKNNAHYPTRKFGIDRVRRALITMKPPPSIGKHEYGPWNPFDSGMCSSVDPAGHDEGCIKRWAAYGYTPGCLNHPFNQAAIGEQYYDFPAACPVHDFKHWDDACKLQYPGGSCIRPDGRKDCTWHFEEAGEIMLDELEGITMSPYKTWANFSAHQMCEFDKVPGQCKMNGLHGDPLPFWDNVFSAANQKIRADKLVQIFKFKFPNSAVLPEPTCDPANHPAAEQLEQILI